MKRIFLFIVLMRALAAILITNAHYTGVYPTDMIANGGLLGNVIFFSVSGFCLANTTGSFPKWYLKRFIRIYTPAWIITLIYIVLGAYVIRSGLDVAKFFIWPTHWHFIASIILLYIPLFFVSKYLEMNRKNYCILALVVLTLQLGLYFTVYDRSYYHIDTVVEPMIEFLFFQSMLLGLHYRWRCNNNEGELRKPLGVSLICVGGGLAIIYFASKLLFVNFTSLSPFQILNQVVLWALLYVLFQICMRLEDRLKKIECSKVWACIKFVADRTLEIYLVQFVILEHLKIGPFPFNWLLLTTTIILSATCLRWLSQRVIRRINI